MEGMKYIVLLTIVKLQIVHQCRMNMIKILSILARPPGHYCTYEAPWGTYTVPRIPELSATHLVVASQAISKNGRNILKRSIQEIENDGIVYACLSTPEYRSGGAEYVMEAIFWRKTFPFWYLPWRQRILSGFMSDREPVKTWFWAYSADQWRHWIETKQKRFSFVLQSSDPKE